MPLGSTNPYARPPYCSLCGDFRVRTRNARASKSDLVPCDRCGLLTEDEYQRFKRDAWIKNQTPPTICELDLTPEEFKVCETLKALNPHASKATVLSWMEGQRYDPSKDEEFLREARQKFKEWKHR